EAVLEGLNVAGQGGRVDLVAVGNQVGFLGPGEDPGIEEPVEWGAWGVVAASAPPSSVGVPPDRFLGGGEEIEAIIDQGPEPVQQGESLRGVIAPVEAIAAHQVVVLGLDGGLVVLLIGPRAGEEDLA